MLTRLASYALYINTKLTCLMDVSWIAQDEENLFVTLLLALSDTMVACYTYGPQMGRHCHSSNVLQLLKAECKRCR